MSRQYSKPYDPKLRETEHGSNLYQLWRRIRKHPHCEEWDYFPTFYEWAMESGYEISTWLRRYDKNEPYSRDNCIWHYPEPFTREWIDSWNNAANRIRKHYGMPPLEGTKYDD